MIQTITDSNNIVQAVYTDYEPTGKIGQIDYHNNTATKYTYDAWSTKLFGIVTEDPTRDPNKLLQDREYTYSRAGDILRIVDHVQKVTYDYTYDMLHRLVSEKLSGINAPIVTKVETITLDYSGPGPVHGVKAIDLNGVSRTCAYDANGNMVTSPDFTNGANPLSRAITYDGDNMPTRIVHANGKTVDFVYDGVGKRTKKLVQSGKTVLYLGDHFEVENGVNIKYIFGGNLRLAQIKGSLTSYFHKDHLGSTAAVTDEAGVKIESTTYEPFGSTRTQEGTPVSAYKFTDQELDNETGLYNYDARLYDPVLGMFVTPDSIVPGMFDPQMLNRYTYCRNNPLIYVDPSGHIPDDLEEAKKDMKRIAEEKKATAILNEKLTRNEKRQFPTNVTGIAIDGWQAAFKAGCLPPQLSYTHWIDLKTNKITIVNKFGMVVGVWSFRSGVPGKYASIGIGGYRFTDPPSSVPASHNHQSSYCDPNNDCWWDPITPTTADPRYGLGYHPDGTTPPAGPGTQGCVGLTSNNTKTQCDFLKGTWDKTDIEVVSDISQVFPGL